MQLSKKLNLIYLSEFWVFFHLFGGVLIPFFMDWGGLSITQIMILQAWFSLWVVLFEVPTGTLADRIGRKNTCFLGLGVLTIGLLGYGTFQDFWIYLFFEMLWALAFALFSGAKEALLYDTLVDHDAENQSKKVMSRFNSSHLLGIMISAPIGGLIAEYFGLNWVMLAMILPMILSGLALAFVPEPKSHKHEDEQEHIPFREQIRGGWKFFREHEYLGVMAFDMVTIWTLAFMLIWFQQLVMEDIGIPIEYFGWFVTFSLAMQILILQAYPYFEKKLSSKKRVLTISGFLPAIGFLLLAVHPSLWTILVAIVFCAGFGMTRRTLYVSYLNKFIPSRQRATVNSFINLGIHLVGVIIKPGLGLLADYRLDITFYLLAAAVALVTVFSKVEEKMLVDEIT